MSLRNWTSAVVGVFVTLALLMGLAVFMAASGPSAGPPTVWEYRTISVRLEADANPAQLQTTLTTTLNSQSAQGWEYVGPCARQEGDGFSVDYVVFRKKKF